ncbi:MAG: hypothetical protein IKS37_11080 [Solobacterium sp.]|nr:hypothetical protein [Solobacterium sp.]
MRKEAFRSLRNSPANALFFALTFYLTTALLFAYFHMAATVMGDQPEVFINSNHLADIFQQLEKGNAGNLMMVFIVIMCAVDLIFANDFFVKNKAKEIGIRLMCGATYTQLAFYLLIQTMILMAAAIPLGILSGYGLLLWMQNALQTAIPLDGYAWMEFIAVMTMIVFWTTALNCSFAYKSGAVLLAGGNMNALMKKENPYGLKKSKTAEYILNIVGILAALFPLVQFAYGGIGMIVGMVIGCIGLNRVLENIVVPALTKHTRRSSTKKTENVLRNGFLRRDILFSRLPVFLYLTDILVLLAMMTRNNTPLEASLVKISYGAVCILQALTILFRLATDLSTRTKEYRIMDQIGADAEMRERIPVLEIVWYGLFLLAITLFYIGTALYFVVGNGSLPAGSAVFAVLFAVVPLLICLGILLVYYRRNVLGESL